MFVARDGDKVVLVAHQRQSCDGVMGAFVDAGSSDTVFDARLLCYMATPTYLRVARLGDGPGQPAAIRKLAATLSGAPATDPAPRLPAPWLHADDAPLHLVAGVWMAFLYDAAAAPACDEPCVHDREPMHRFTRGHLVLDVPLASEAQPAEQALVAWFNALPDDTQATRPVALPFTPPPAPPPSATPAATPAPPATYDEPHHPFNAASMVPKRYEILVNQNWLAPPVDLVFLADNQSDKPAFVPVQAIGVTIIEHGPGIIGLVNSIFLAGAGGFVGTNDTSSGRYDVYETNMTSGPGPEASWSFNMSDAYMGFRADTWWTSWIGWRFGLWSLRQLNSDTTQAMPGPTQDILNRYGAAYLNSTGGVEIELMMRKQLVMSPLGLINAVIDLPVPYLCAEPMVAAGVLDPGDRAMMFSWGGVPRISADFQRRMGPLMVHAVASMPTTFLIVPMMRGGQLTLSAGVTF